MPHFKRKSPKQQVRCTGCTKHRWRGRKPFAIERRFTRDSQIVKQVPSWGEWGVWSRYRTERARDEALAALRKGRSTWSPVEFRAA